MPSLSPQQLLALYDGNRPWPHGFGGTVQEAYEHALAVREMHMTVEEACETVCAMTLLKSFEFTPECERAMDDVALASRIRANLAIDPATSDLELEVAAHSGSVVVRGELLTANQASDVRRIARANPGVHAVHLNDLTVMASRF